MKYNYMYVAMHSFNVWSSLAVVITVVTPDQWVGFVIWCMFPLGVGIGCFLCKKRLASRPLKAGDLRREFTHGSIDVAIDCENPYLNATRYQTVSAILQGKESQCLSFRPTHLDMLMHELQTDSGKVAHVEQTQKNMKEEKKKKKKQGKKGATTQDEEAGDEEKEDMIPAYEFRADWLCIHASNQTKLSERGDRTDREIDDLSRCVANCKELVVLRLNGWNLKGDALRKFVDMALADSMNAECRHENLRVVDFGDNQMNAEDATYVLDKVHEMQENCGDMIKLEEICLANNYVGDSKGSELQRSHALGTILVV